MHPTYRGLAFLLSLGSLPIACNKDDNETDATGGTGSTGTTDANTPTTTSLGGSTSSSASETSDGTTTDTTTDATTGVLDTGDTEPVVTTFLTSNTDTGTGDTGDTDEPPPLPEPTDPTCLAYAANFAGCYPNYAAYRTSFAQYCELYKTYGLRTDGQACVDAFEAYYVCVSKVECADFMEGCATEIGAAMAACPNFFEEGSTTTGIESEGDGSDGSGDISSSG